MEASSHLDGRASSRDEIEDEQAEAELRNKLNKDFQSFVKRVEDVSAQSGSEIEFDIPYQSKEAFFMCFYFVFWSDEDSVSSDSMVSPLRAMCFFSHLSIVWSVWLRLLSLSLHWKM